MGLDLAEADGGLLAERVQDNAQPLEVADGAETGTEGSLQGRGEGATQRVVTPVEQRVENAPPARGLVLQTLDGSNRCSRRRAGG